VRGQPERLGAGLLGLLNSPCGGEGENYRLRERKKTGKPGVSHIEMRGTFGWVKSVIPLIKDRSLVELRPVRGEE